MKHSELHPLSFLRSIVDWAVSKSLRPYSRRGKTLIVRLDGIGDFLLWIDSGLSLREAFCLPEHELILVTTKEVRELAERLKLADHYVFVDVEKFRKQLIYRYTLLRTIRAYGVETAINLTYSRRPALDDSVIRATGAEHRIGFKGDDSNVVPEDIGRTSGWYTNLIPSPESEWEYDRGFLLNDALGVSRRLSTFRIEQVLTIPIDPSLTSFINSSDYFVLFPGAQWDWKRWPLESFSSIAKRLYQETGWACLICGGRDVIASIASLTSQMTGVPVFSAVGHTSLCELFYLISRARLLLSNDTAAVHLAAIAATPCVAVLGGGQFGRFLPYKSGICGRSSTPLIAFTRMECFGCDWFCKFDVKKGQPVPCIQGVTVEQVWTKMLELLGSAALHRES